ncbi:hypothetical protein LO772_16870 [Yinghuangia sp. ASG 101]|uniref:hypothetical protein n=1 Tax=Yinghuangia sp. ASG 101 TaxID=2896848 RepID=UPI001E393F49|nr:hypothetical protein [Yinghuangia sp. ASG 101]UGQ15086.1 hypothetical protein LO772_16870 [Yinghuangia sp. ASG 101]
MLRVRTGAILCALGAIALLWTGATRSSGQNLPGTVLTVLAAGLSLLIAWAALGLVLVRKPRSGSVPLPVEDAPEFHRMVAGLAADLDVPAPDEVRICPECDSWLEQDTRRPWSRPRTVLVVGAPFVWWLRVGELRALLAPVVAGTAPATDPAIASARAWVRRLDAVAHPYAARVRPPSAVPWTAPLRRVPRAFARQLVDLSRGPAEVMERDVAAWASARAQEIDAPLRATAHEQVGLAYAGWDRLLTRLAAPAWDLGRYPDALMAGVVAALTELSQRDRLADVFGARLAERPACDLLVDPARVDARVSRLAADIFADDGERRPVGWEDYPGEVIEPIWRTRASVLVDALDASDGRRGPANVGRVLDRIRDRAPGARRGRSGPARHDAAAFDPEHMTDHVIALVACAAVDTGRMHAAVDWLDGAVLADTGDRVADLPGLVGRAVDDHDDVPLRTWLDGIGVRTGEPIRLGG